MGGADGRISTGGVESTCAAAGALRRRCGSPAKSKFIEGVGGGDLGDSDNLATRDNDALVAPLGFESSQVQVKSDPSQPSNPDVCPLPTPKPLRGALQAAPEAASAAEESSSYGSRGSPVSRSERESAAAAAALTAEKARQSLPAWARLATPSPAGGAIHRRSSGGEGVVGSGGGNGLAAARGGASRRDAVVRGEMMVFGEGGGGGLIGGPQMKPRRGSRGEPTSVLSAAMEENVRFQHPRGLPPTPVSPRKYFSSSPVDASVFVGVLCVFTTNS